MAQTQTLPTDLEVLDKARSALSDARDWLNSDTTDAIAGRRSTDTAEYIYDALAKITRAKGAIDGAKGAIYAAKQAVR